MPTIVLDSNTLHGRASPEAANELRPLLALAAQVGTPVAILKANVIELREGLREKIREARVRFESAVAGLQKLMVGVVVPEINEEAELTRYTQRLEAFLNKHSITVLPFAQTYPDTAALFEAAASKRRPFDASGNSYRDAIVGLTAESYAREKSELVFLVTRDEGLRSVYSEAPVIALTIDETVRVLEERLTRVQQEHRARIRDEIAGMLRERLADVTGLATEAVEFELEVGPLDALVSIDGFAARCVTSVEPGNADRDCVDFTAVVEGELSYTSREKDKPNSGSVFSAALAERMTRPKKVGEDRYRKPGGQRVFRVSLLPPTLVHETTSIQVEVGGKATVAGGRVTELDLTSAKHLRGAA